MRRPLVITPKECQSQCWLPPENFNFAANQGLIPLHAGELAKAATSMPLALAREKRDWKLVAVTGLASQQNLFVGPQGQWLGQYRPQWLSVWPLEVVRVGDKNLIAFDQDSGLLSDQGEPFYTADNQPGPALAARLEALREYDGLQQVTRKAIEALRAVNLLIPWPQSLRESMGITIEGLHMVDERALKDLDDAAFLSLRENQALPLAYALNLSLPQGHLLMRLARMKLGRMPAESLDQLFEGPSDDLTFDFDR